MASPLQTSPTSIFTGSTGNPLIDAMLITVETLKVMVAQRATVVGETVVKWGGPFGTGANLTYSFITASSVFASDTGPEKTGIVEMQEGLRQHFRNAFAQWSNIANVTFQETVETATTAGDIRIGVTSVGVAPGGASAGPPGFSTTAAGDIWVSSTLADQAAQNSVSVEFAVHELGHAIFGLNDVTTNLGLHGAYLPPSLNEKSHTVMSYSVVPGIIPGAPYQATQGGYSVMPTTPMVLDVLAAQYVYGPNMNYHAGDDVYHFTPGESYFETIWDAGGRNTFDASLISQDCVLDLQPGHYSNVGTTVTVFNGQGTSELTSTVAIAYGAVIQNAIGGSGNDTIIGNDASNFLTGGGGNDAITGGLGDTVGYSGVRTNYLVTQLSINSIRILDTRPGSPDGSDTINNINTFQFADHTYTLDQILPARAPIKDFNGDGKSDILWRNDAGQVSIWDMDKGTVLSGNQVATISSDWKIAGTGDFNGDHKADILWRHDEGRVSIWDMDNGTVLSGNPVVTISSDWKIAGTSDFNSDGKADILWRHVEGGVSIWDMDNGTVLSGNPVATVSSDWKIAGTGDFNGDGKSDILWRHDTGLVSIWDMDNGTVLSNNQVATVSFDWKIAGTGDFNGDSKTDILWRHDTGRVSIWDMDNGTILSGNPVATIPSDWKIAGTGDFNGDHKADILWRHDTGRVSIWEMDNGTVVSGNPVATIPNDWHIV